MKSTDAWAGTEMCQSTPHQVYHPQSDVTEPAARIIMVNGLKQWTFRRSMQHYNTDRKLETVMEDWVFVDLIEPISAACMALGRT